MPEAAVRLLTHLEHEVVHALLRRRARTAYVVNARAC